MYKIIEILTLLFFVSSSLFATSELVKLDEQYSKLNSYRAIFLQYNYDSLQDKFSTTKGELFFKKPGLMKWIYYEPDAQEIYINDLKIWLFDPVLNNVVIKVIEENDLTESLLFFRSKGSILSRFRELKRSKESIIEIKEQQKLIFLEPQKTSKYVKEIHLAYNAKSYQLEQIGIIEHSKNYRVFSFSKFHKNLVFSKDFFTFKASKNIEIIDEN